MSTTQAGLRQREKHGKRKTTPEPSRETDDVVLAKAKLEFTKPKQSDWDYKLALVVLTLLAFATRFYGISHPNQVVFDEVHFGKVIICKFLLHLEAYKVPSLPHTTSKEHTSSMFILPSVNSSSLSLVGS